jgi:phosphohistidine phosphatase
MRTLYIARHAKSSWTDPQLADFERPLNERGLAAAPFMGKFMRDSGHVPDKIVSSPATRARQTAELFKEGGSFTPEIEFDGRIYEASPRAWREIVSELPDSAKDVMLVGHNLEWRALFAS